MIKDTNNMIIIIRSWGRYTVPSNISGEVLKISGESLQNKAGEVYKTKRVSPQNNQAKSSKQKGGGVQKISGESSYGVPRIHCLFLVFV